MTQGRTDTLVRGLLAVALLLSFGLFGGTCTSNVGGVFNGNTGDGGSGGGGNGGGGGVQPPPPPAPPQALFDGAVSRAGAPRAVAFGPANGATGVDVQAPIAVWFSESLAQSSVNIGSLGIRRVNGGGGVNRTVAFYNANRCVVLVPTSPLLPNTQYEIFATDDLHDLGGNRFVETATQRLARFTTATATTGLDPQVIGSFPPAGAINEPHDGDVLVLFSKPVSYQTVIANTRVEQVDALGNPTGVAAVDAPASAEQGGRVFPYTRTEGAGALDLGERLAVAVDPGVEDTEFNVHTLADPYQAAWQTLDFAAPVSLSTAALPGGPDQDLNLALLGAFPLRVDVAGNGIAAGDRLQARIGERFPASALAGTQSRLQETVLTAAQVGGTPVVFSFDFIANPALPALSILQDGSLAIHAWIERGGVRSAARALPDLVQDTVPPILSRFGPPFASSAGTFATDLPELRPYGTANEPIGAVEARFGANPFTAQLAASPSVHNWFLGAEVGGLGPTELFSLSNVDFELLLADAAGNPMPATVTGRAAFRGFVGDVASTDSMLVQVVDARSLAPVFGCTLQIEAEDGSDFRAAVTAVSGQRSFTGLASRAYHVTVTAPGYHAATFYGLQSTVVSLPLRPVDGGAQSITPSVSLANANGGQVRLASPLLLDEDGLAIPEAKTDATVPFGFDFTGASVRADRPGWFAGFFRLSATDPITQFALDPRVVVDPFSASTVSATPLLEMTPLSGVARVDFPLNFPAVPGHEGLRTSAVATLPGLVGPAPIGSGEDFPTGSGATSSTTTVTDQLRQAAADYAGVDFADLPIDLIARADFGQGAFVAARYRDADPVGPNNLVWPSNVPTVQLMGVDPQAIAGTPLQFRDSLALDGAPGYYRVVIDDGVQQWDLWVPASVRLAGNPPFPTLDSSPLDDNLDAVWTMFVEAFHMPLGFAEQGFFFRVLERDWNRRGRAAERTITS